MKNGLISIFSWLAVGILSLITLGFFAFILAIAVMVLAGWI